MKFCPECGEDLKNSTKFCPECGISLLKYFQNTTIEINAFEKNDTFSKIEDNIETSNQEEAIPYESELNIVQKSTRELGNSLEESVAKIFQDRGYEITLRQKLKGKSNQLNEIDVIARRNRITIAIECKNYADNNKVGIKEIRDFVAKLEDLDINKGYFVTSSDFSADAIGWAENNPNEKQIELWDGSTFMEQWKAVVLGRGSNKTIRIENGLELKGDISDYVILTLKNADKVSLRRCDVLFHPFFLVSFDIIEEFKTPDKKMHSYNNSGEYYVDGLSGEILYCTDNRGNTMITSEKEEVQFVKEIEDFEPRKDMEIVQKSDYKILKLEPTLTMRDAEFRVRTYASRDNQSRILYEVKISKEKYDKREFLHTPNPNSMRIKSRILYVPKVDVEFESKEHTYLRTIFPASEVWIRDEIAKCKHFLNSKHTYAVCDVCGIAKCEKDILVDENDICYCKKHAPENVKDENKTSIKDKFKKFKFR